MALIRIEFEDCTPYNLHEIVPSDNYIAFSKNSILMWEQDWNEIDNCLPLHTTHPYNNGTDYSIEHNGETTYGYKDN